eukprot:g14833.t1
MYRMADAALLTQCARYTQHYATCTSVTVLIVGDLLVVGHLGDSRVILVKEEEAGSGILVGEQLTLDHKPDLDCERQRIEQCGGMVERLQNHGNKPFIRGGDFIMRKASAGDRVCLVQSRNGKLSFPKGGKKRSDRNVLDCAYRELLEETSIQRDRVMLHEALLGQLSEIALQDLKIFGLSSVPDVKIIRMDSGAVKNVRFLVLASDGLWDVMSAQEAARQLQEAIAHRQHPAECLVQAALNTQGRLGGRADNITAVTVQFD